MHTRMPIHLPLLILAFCPVSAGAQEPSHVDEARKLLQLMDVRATLDQTHDEIYAQLEGMADQLGITEEQRPIFEKYVEKMVEAMQEELSWQQMGPLMLDLYVEVHTEQDTGSASPEGGSV